MFLRYVTSLSGALLFLTGSVFSLPLIQLSNAWPKPSALQGEWDIHWKKLLPPEQTLTQKPDLTRDPVFSWSGIFTANGYATYATSIQVPEDIHALGLRVPYMYTNYILYADSVQISHNGIVSDNPEAMDMQFFTRYVQIPVKNKKVHLVLQIANREDLRGGLINPIKVGSPGEIFREYHNTSTLEMLLFGSILIISFYHFGLFVLRRKDYSALFFAIFCLLIAIRLCVTSETFSEFLYTYLPNALVIKSEYLSLYLALPAFVCFIYFLYTDVMWKVIVNASLILAGIFSLSILGLPHKLYSKIEIWHHLGGAIILLVIFIVYIRAIQLKKDGAVAGLSGYVFFYLSVINDILYDTRLIQTGYIMPLGLFFFILAQSFQLSAIFANAFNRIDQLSRRMKELDKIKDEFLANTSHELKTPLTITRGLIDLVLSGAKGDIAQEARESLSISRANIERLNYLVSDLLDFALLRNRDITLNKTAFTLNSVIDSVVYAIRPMLDGKPVSLKAKYSKDYNILADENRVNQMLINLLSNAVKFTSAGEINIFTSDDSTFVNIHVKDTGIGIPAEKLESIFGYFEQGDSSISRNYGGTGLGLAITRNLAQLHGGNISVISEIGMGSEFILSLPLQSAAITMESKSQTEKFFSRKDRSPGIQPSPALMEHANSEEGSILVIDDESGNRLLLTEILSANGYSVASISDAASALALSDKLRKFDLLILDVMMPGTSGYELAEKIREIIPFHELPILLLTALNAPQHVVAGLRAGANDFLAKPFENEVLIARVRSLVSFRRGIHALTKLKAVENEMQLAALIQKSALPALFPDIKIAEYSAFYQTAESVGGDIYDFVIARNNLYVLLADASGHGISAALLASMAQITFSSAVNEASEPAEIFKKTSDLIHRRSGDFFLTAVCCAISLETALLRYSHAGHPPIILIRDGVVLKLKTKGKFLGPFPEAGCEQGELQLTSGDLLVLYTDGITEAENPEGEMYTDHRLENFCLRNSWCKARQFTELFRTEIENFSGKKTPDDDQTLIVFKFT